MVPTFCRSAWLRRTGLLTASLSLLIVTTLTGASKAPLRNLKLDPTAETVDLFDAQDEGQVAIRITPRDVSGGNVFIENKTDKPLTVKLPQSFVGVHVLKQFGGMGGMGGGMGGMGGMGGGMGGMGGGMGGMGGGQSMGGGMGGMGGGMMGGMGGGGMGGMGGMGGGMNMFSIPPERTAQVPYHSICLNHGKPDPMPRMTYVMVRPEVMVEDKTLLEMLNMYGTGRISQTTAQAAAWHLTDDMSWQELAMIKRPRVFGSPVMDPVFPVAHLQAAQELLSQSAAQAREKEKNAPPAHEKLATSNNPRRAAGIANPATPAKAGK